MWNRIAISLIAAAALLIGGMACDPDPPNYTEQYVGTWEVMGDGGGHYTCRDNAGGEFGGDLTPNEGFKTYVKADSRVQYTMRENQFCAFPFLLEDEITGHSVALDCRYEHDDPNYGHYHAQIKQDDLVAVTFIVEDDKAPLMREEGARQYSYNYSELNVSMTCQMYYVLNFRWVNKETEPSAEESGYDYARFRVIPRRDR